MPESASGGRGLHCGGGLHAGGVSMPGGCVSGPGGGGSPCLGGVPGWGEFSMPGGSSPCQTPLPVNRMTDRCKNITLAKTSFRPVTRV